MRSLSLLIVLLAASSAATATEHYTEVWNPPEARATRPHARPHARSLKHLAKRSPKLAKGAADVRQAAAGPGRPAKQPRVVRQPVAPAGKRVDIPPVIGPDGQVLWVRDDSVLFG